MALFEIKRYELFENSSHSESKGSVLKNLLKEAKKRKKDSQSNEVPEEDAQTSGLKGKRSKRKHEEQVTESNVPKKKRKKDSQILETENIPIKEEEESIATDGETNVPKKKKKKREKKSQILETENIPIKEEEESIATSGKTQGKSEGKKLKNVKSETDKEEKPKSELEVKEEEDKVIEMPDIEGPHEFGGFTILGDYKEKALDKVNRVLPDWLAHPSVFKPDLTSDHLPVSDLPHLDDDLKQKLLDNGITHFFPVQYQVIPALLHDIKFGTGVGCGGFRARDICCSSPTGSGKTLAFVLPIIQALKLRVVRRVRALVILPVRTLAQQVYKVFQIYAEDFGLKVGLIMGEKSFEKEQLSLVKKRMDGYESLVDIVVATPGKLVDHILQTEGFDLRHLRFLVIDEADRVIDDIKHDWLMLVEKAVYGSNENKNNFDTEFTRPKPGPITIANCLKINIPFQKLLFSATLSDNSQKLKQLNLFQPQLFSAMKSSSNKLETKVKSSTKNSQKTSDKVSKKATTETKLPDENLQEFVIPKCLIEQYIVCSPSYKPLILFYLMISKKYKRVLCFTKSTECTHRLFLIAKSINKFTVAKISSEVKRDQKKKILSRFESEKIDLLVCTDAMARGMDLNNVELVVNYDCPSHVETYVHRVGRTARAGKEGTAITFIQVKEATHFKTLRKKCGSKHNFSRLRIKNENLEPLIPSLKEALDSLPQIIKDEGKRKNTNSIDLGI